MTFMRVQTIVPARGREKSAGDRLYAEAPSPEETSTAETQMDGAAPASLVKT
ncbi:MAG: hypothetical protein DHS20C04_14550 [Hyphococcus sp.]|nr:MAG: hypothetical protein DHS20C04_14550 [Marinicaulis sp.]